MGRHGELEPEVEPKQSPLPGERYKHLGEKSERKIQNSKETVVEEKLELELDF